MMYIQQLNNLMNKTTQPQTDKPLFDNLRKLISLIDSFRDVGLHEHIELPRIAVLGTQSSGKSSLLQNIVGLDFLPRGSGIVTRRPLELRMVHLNNPVSKPYGIFEQVDKQKKYYDFDEIRKAIEIQTDKIAGVNKGVVDVPLKLTVYSYECPDLTLIDLPGITKISIGNQNINVQQVTIRMAKRYCAEQRTVILCVIPANADMSTSQGLDLARQWDPDGHRTLGVITKIDIMDRGTDATKMITNQQIKLNLGYVGIKNRSQEQINNKVKVSIALNNEDEYFKNHPIYRNIDPRYLGTRSLTKRLTQILQRNINKHLHSILKQINIKAKQCQDVIKSLGQPLPKDGKQKIFLIWKLLTEFSDQYKAAIKGKSKQNQQKIDSQVKLSVGSIIKSMFEELYEKQSAKDYKVSGLDGEVIQKAIKNHQGDSIPGFPSIHAFLYLLSPHLEKLKPQALQLLNNVYTQLRKLSGQLITQISKKAPTIMDSMINLTDQFLLKLKTRTQQIILANIESEINYIFTNDEDYLNKRTKLIPRPQNKNQNVNNKNQNISNKNQNINNKKDNTPTIKKQKDMATNKQSKDNTQNLDKDNTNTDNKDKKDDKNAKDQKKNTDSRRLAAQTKEEMERLKKEAQKMFIQELRLRVQHYYRLVVRTLREIVPKNIGNFLVRESQESLQYSLYNELLKDEHIIDSLAEPPQITQQRDTAQKTLDVLNKAKRIVRKEISTEDQSKIKA